MDDEVIALVQGYEDTRVISLCSRNTVLTKLFIKCFTDF